MIFASPIWLVGLAAWGVAAVWLLRRRGVDRTVPFLNLWPRSGAKSARWRKPGRPPVGVVLLLLGTLAALLAAAGPGVRGGRVAAMVLVDHGLSMSVSDATGKPRYVAAVEQVRQWLAGAQIQVEDLPEVDEGAVRGALGQSDGVVVVVSDRAVGVRDARVVQVYPPNPVVNVGIERAGARAKPVAQVMVRIANHSKLTRAKLVIEADGDRIERGIDLPGEGGAENYFMDLPAAAKRIVASVEAGDGPAPNHEVVLVRRGAWPVVEARSPLPTELERMIGVFDRDRVGDVDSPRVGVYAAGDASVDANTAAAIVAGGNLAVGSGGPMAIHPLRGELRVVEGPLTEDVDWGAVVSGGSAASPVGGGWMPVVSVGDVAVVAERESPARQVWVGLMSPGFARRADFVVFWSHVFQWLGEGSGTEVYAATPAGERVLDAARVGNAEEEQREVKSAAMRARGVRDLSGVMLVVAAGLVAAAGCLWGRRAIGERKMASMPAG